MPMHTFILELLGTDRVYSRYRLFSLPGERTKTIIMAFGILEEYQLFAYSQHYGFVKLPASSGAKWSSSNTGRMYVGRLGLATK